MSKHLTIALSAALLSACTINEGGTASDGSTGTGTDTNTASGTSGTGTTEAPTTANPTTGTGTTEAPTTGTTEAPTTGATEAPTTGVTSSTGDTGSTGDTEGSTGIDTDADTDADTGGLYGMCGWNVMGYYACADMGGIPGTEDPLMTDPIACPQNLKEGDPCNDMGMGGIGSVGCCTPEGVNYFCDLQGTKKVFADDCAI